MSIKGRTVLGGQLHLWIHLQTHISVVPFEGPLHLWFQYCICLTIDDGGSTPLLDPSPALFISILFPLHLHKSYFVYILSVILIALNNNLELSVYVHLGTSSKKKLICVPTHYYLSLPYSAVNWIFFNFSHVCQIYVAEVLIIHFYRNCHLRFLSPYEYQSQVNFWGVNPSPDSYSCSTFLGSTPSLVPVPNVSS